ncbi:MAG: MFS transporter, partial [Bacillota bacterium]
GWAGTRQRRWFSDLVLSRVQCMRIPNPLATRFGRLAAFFLLYVTEGIPLGFTATAIVTRMRREGVGAKDIGFFFGAMYLPWAWKWLVGPVVDVVYSRRLGRRRGWILAMHLLMSIGLMAMMPIDFKGHIQLFTAAVMLVNLFSATQDVAIDALACGVLSQSERGLANGMMFAGAYVGQAVGGAGVLLLTDHLPFNTTFFLVAAAILSVTIFIVLPMRESAALEQAAEGPSGYRDISRVIGRYLVDAMRAFFGTRAALAGLAFALLPAGAYALSLALASILAVELGMSDKAIGYVTLVTSITSALGCVAGGYLSDRFGRRRMLAVYILTTAIPTIYLAVAMHEQGWIMPRSAGAIKSAAPSGLIVAFWIASVVYAISQGLMYGTRTAAFMDICTPQVAATQFTAYMALLNVVISYSSSWQGWTIEHWGYPITLVLDGVLGLACIAVLPFMKPRAMADSGARAFPVVPTSEAQGAITSR